MTALGVKTLATYYTVYVAVALAITELFIHLDAKAKRSLTVISIVLFIGFLFALSLQILRIIS
ncbi:MAG: hypothetical protein PHR56_00785 [Dehalococcoidales bacterium]|nr:hypothetical protein [Dehalococcoidales bacterium]